MRPRGASRGGPTVGSTLFEKRWRFRALVPLPLQKIPARGLPARFVFRGEIGIFENFDTYTKNHVTVGCLRGEYVPRPLKLSTKYKTVKSESPCSFIDGS